MPTEPKAEVSMMHLLILVILTTVPLARSLEACASISNSECKCTNSSASSLQADIICTFKTMPQVPLFSNLSEPTTLGTVDLSGKSLQDLPEDFFRGNLTVGRLVLSKNNLTGIPKAVASLVWLGSLNVSDNQLTSLSVDLLAGVKGLQELDASGNQLADAFTADKQETAIAKKLTVKTLYLSRNGISSIVGKHLAAMCKLTTLDLSHNALTEITSQMFSPVKLSLYSLNLFNNSVSRIESQALAQLGHLRVLNLAYNRPLTNLDQVFFPKHLASLDMSHCALRIINHCRLSSLADLSFIGLSGNDLQCTCQLYLLLQWYQNQHHAGAQEDYDWTCTNASNALVNHDNASNSDPHVRKVADLHDCKDVENHCNAMEHGDHHVKGSSQLMVTLTVAATSDTLMASWTLQENGEVAVEGFRLRYMPEDGEQMSSTVIPADQRSYVMEPSELEIHFMVCLDVLAYQSAVVQQECLSYKDESGNIVVGILAGVVFLLPCVVAMAYVFYKDHVIRRETRYEELAKVGVENQSQVSSSEVECVFILSGAAASAGKDLPPLRGPDTPVSSNGSAAGGKADDLPNNVPHIVVTPEDVTLTPLPQSSADGVPAQETEAHEHKMTEDTATSSDFSHPELMTPAQTSKQYGVDNVGYINSEDDCHKSCESTDF